MAGNGTRQSDHAASQTADWPIHTRARLFQSSSSPLLSAGLKDERRSFGLAACNAPTFWASLLQSLTPRLSAHCPVEPTAVLARLHSPPTTHSTHSPSFSRQPTSSPLHLPAQTLTVHASRVIVVLVEFKLTSSECAALPFIFFTSSCVSSRIPALVISNLNPSFRAPPQNLYHQPSPACTSITI